MLLWNVWRRTLAEAGNGIHYDSSGSFIAASSSSQTIGSRAQRATSELATDVSPTMRVMGLLRGAVVRPFASDATAFEGFSDAYIIAFVWRCRVCCRNGGEGGQLFVVVMGGAIPLAGPRPCA